MSATRPLKFDTDQLKEFSDSELEELSYNIRVAYVSDILAGDDVPGKVSRTIPSADYNIIGTAIDRIRTVATSTRNNDNSPPPGYDSTPTVIYPTIKYAWANVSYTTYQHQTAASWPTLSVLNSNSYIIFDSAASNLKIAGETESDIINNVINDVRYQIKSGDELGSYRIAQTPPVTGTWANNGIAFTDSLYSSINGIYYLYFKTENAAGEIPASTGTYPLRYENHATHGKIFKEMEMGPTSNLIQNIFLPILKKYFVSYILTLTPYWSNPTWISKGTILDTYYSDTTTTVTGSSVYTRIDTPTTTGSVTTTNYYFNAI